MLQIHRLQSPVTVLGPLARAVIWVQGCDIGCKGCLAPYTQDPGGGLAMSVEEVSDWILQQEDIDGITISGGEPTLQSRGLVALIDTVRKHRDLGVVCYTGRTIEQLQLLQSGDITALLERVDLLIDGPYVRKLHSGLLWRGSSNQRLIPLTDRYRHIVESLRSDTDRSAGLEFTASEGQLYYAGVPADSDFEMKLWREMISRDFVDDHQ